MDREERGEVDLAELLGGLVPLALVAEAAYLRHPGLDALRVLAARALGDVQGAVGTIENRLGYAISLAQSQIVNTKAAESRIRDANIAEESSNLTRFQILSQSGIAVLAQASNLRVAPHVWGGAVGLATACHFIAALPNTPHTDHPPVPLMLEYDMSDNELRTRLLKTPLSLEAGHVLLPQGPGLGIELDVNAMADKISHDWTNPEAYDADDGSVVDW